MGFRTANLVVPDQMRPLGDGVYAAYAHVDGVRYKAAVNVGVAATFADRATATCEVHLLDFSGDLSLLAAPYEKVRRSGRVDSHREGQHSLGAREPVALYFTAQAESLLKRLSYWTVAYACSASSTPAASSLPNPCQMPSAVRNPFRLMAGTASRMASRKR